MTTEFRMPQLGITMEEATVVRWFKEDGAMVTRSEMLLEVETDKVTMSVEAPADGQLRIVSQPAEVVRVGGLLARIEGAGAEGEQPAAPGPVAAVAAAAPGDRDRHPDGRIVRAAPAARVLARRLGVTLAEVHGTGPGGRVLPADVAAAVAVRQALPSVPEVVATQPSAPVVADAQLSAPAPPPLAPARSGSLQAVGPVREVIPLAGIRRTIAGNMLRSLQTTAQVTCMAEVDMTEVEELRTLARVAGRGSGISITVTDVVARALALALGEFPQLNALALDDGLHVAAGVNLSLAVDTPSGLIVPVVRDAQTMSLPGLSRAIRQVVEGARERRLGPDAFAGGTFTLSNVGKLPVTGFTPILNPPQVGLLGMGGIQDRPWAVRGQVTVRSVAALNLTFDHRWIDGRPAAEFASRVKEILEHAVHLFGSEVSPGMFGRRSAADV